jgi:glycosyltransferase involved in cell wall biosynthesis
MTDFDADGVYVGLELIEANRKIIRVWEDEGRGYSLSPLDFMREDDVIVAFLEAMACGTPALGLAVGDACDALADGELGTALGREDDLGAAMDRLLTGPRTNPQALTGRSRARFGRDAFASRLQLAIGRVCRPA